MAGADVELEGAVVLQVVIGKRVVTRGTFLLSVNRFLCLHSCY